MHYPKPFMPFDQRTFLEKNVEAYRRAGISQVYVVLNADFCTESWEVHLNKVRGAAHILENEAPDLGRFYSLKLGAEGARKADFCFFQNVDNPFIDHNLIKKIWRYKNESGYVLPVYKGRGGHPVLLNKKIVRDVRKCTDTAVTIRDFLAGYSRKEVLINNEAVLVNINDRGGYYREMLKYEVLQSI